MIIAIIDDDAALRGALTLSMQDAGHEVLAGETVAAALRHAERCDVLVTDVFLPEGPDTGITIVREVRRRFPMVDVLVMTGRGTITQAVEAMRLGARTFLQKPFPNATLLGHLSEIEQVRGLRLGVAGRGGLVGSSAGMRRAYQQIDVGAASDLPVLISGETGTGKELAARAIHALSPRRAKPFIALNCAAIPRELAESELFGHEAGAFTGATNKRQGRFQLAASGTLFLDEVNSLPLELQPKLLRALETGEVWPVGAAQPEQSQARLVAAANSDLQQMITAGRFREDLFYRLNVLAVTLPNLRSRIEDVLSIASMIIERESTDGRSLHLASDAIADLLSHSWPGNVRELVNVLRRAVAVASTGVV
ncbi:MAG TPA: sigma-54 dependent transcriptional regulator [Planctomycetota bacterium]|nr:sigma-54 dependent transcriptional regulator [Planctomycetota bacterium]